MATAMAGQAQAAELSCDEAMTRVDTFGRLHWSDRVWASPAWAVVLDEGCGLECGFADPEEVRYVIDQGALLDKELRVGTATRLPWGLKRSDGPKEAAIALAKLIPGEGGMNVREGGPTYNLDIPGCDTWIEVTFDGDRGIKAVSLNSQP
jgi:hypothetical protein